MCDGEQFIGSVADGDLRSGFEHDLKRVRVGGRLLFSLRISTWYRIGIGQMMQTRIIRIFRLAISLYPLLDRSVREYQRHDIPARDCPAASCGSAGWLH